MPSVDDLLRHAFEPTDDDWVRLASSARDEVLARHHRHQLVRRSVVGTLVAASLAVAVSVADGEPRSRGVEPAEPVVTNTATAGATPLEGTWISGTLDAGDVRASARRAGTPGAADRMLDELPGEPFRVVLVVRGSSLRTVIRVAGTEDAAMDEEAISTTGQQVELHPFNDTAASVHRWALDGTELSMSFVSTTEGFVEGVAAEAWQRLLYDSATFSR